MNHYRDRRSVRWLAALPLIGSAILTLAIILFVAPGDWQFVFIIMSLFAYATAFFGVLPILFAFRQSGWVRLVHFAIAGFVGVLWPWLIVGAVADYVPPIAWAALLSAACVGAALSAAFGCRESRSA